MTVVEGSDGNSAARRSPGEHALELQILRETDGGLELVGSRCPRCEKHFYPPRRLCSNDLAECSQVALSSRGTVYEATHIRIAPVGFEAPFWLGYVDLPENVRVFAQIEWSGDAEPRHGDHVELVIKTVRQGSEPVAGPVFTGPA